MDNEMNQKQLEMDLKNTVVPSLTLDPVTESAQPQTFAVNDGKVASVALEKSSLSPEEQRMVDNFADQIDITNSNVVLQFGAATQKKIADFSENALQNVRAKDLGEIGGMLTGLVTELKSFHVEEEEKGFLGFFKKTSNKQIGRAHV